MEYKRKRISPKAFCSGAWEILAGLGNPRALWHPKGTYSKGGKEGSEVKNQTELYLGGRVSQDHFKSGEGWTGQE